MKKSTVDQNMASLVLRLIFGLFILFGHGWNKLLKIIEGDWSFASVLSMPPSVSLMLAIFAEVVCAGLLILGFKTRYVAGMLFATMMIIILFVNSNAPLFIANAQGGSSRELAILYAAGFLAIMFLGGKNIPLIVS